MHDRQHTRGFSPKLARKEPRPASLWWLSQRQRQGWVEPRRDALHEGRARQRCLLVRCCFQFVTYEEPGDPDEEEIHSCEVSVRDFNGQKDLVYLTNPVRFS